MAISRGQISKQVEGNLRGARDEKKKNYIARHEVREKKFYNSPYHPSTLSRFILWGESNNLQDSIKQFKKKYSLV